MADALSRVELKIDDLKQLQCNVVTRTQSKKLKEKTDEELTNKRTEKQPNIVELLRMKNDLPLLKFCHGIEEALKYSDGHIICDPKDLVGYSTCTGVMFLKIPNTLNESTWKDVLQNVKMAFNFVCKKVNITKMAIMKNELDGMPINIIKMLKFLSKTNESNYFVQFFMIPKVTHILYKSQQKRIIENAHLLPTGGHLGREKLMRTLKLRYYWSNMSKDLDNLLRNCKICQTNKQG